MPQTPRKRKLFEKLPTALDRHENVKENVMPTFKRRDQEEFEKAKDLLEAAPAAEMGFVKSLFFGRLKLDAVLPYPKQDAAEAARTDELIAKVDAFLKSDVDAARIDAEERIPQSVL